MLSARFHDSLDDIEATAWDALIGDANPFVSHAFLAGLERCGCIRRQWGWQPHHLSVHDADGNLVAAAPLYLKGNSHGEYVFDWSWAGALERAGGDYYPKLLCAIPYSPVTGGRLLVGVRGELRVALIRAMVEEAQRLGLSSIHANFLIKTDNEAFEPTWLARFDWQFHWHNRGYPDFDAFLATLKHKKRKNILHERAQVARAGLNCTISRGDSLDAAQMRDVHALYKRTFETKGNQATLSLSFFQHLAMSMGENMQLAIAKSGADIVAMALLLRGGDTLYGRYWGSRVEVPGLHFELCYYQGIRYAIANGITHFEPGAQGEHKLARGFMPTRTQSRHYIQHLGLRHAVAEALDHEALALQHYQDDLLNHSPYAQPPE